jgi:radical SAM superfamily enzyme YgiQ (UPF0313 family)
LYEGDESEFQEPLGIERLAGFLEISGVKGVSLFDRRLYEQERRSGLVGKDTPDFWDDFACAFPKAAPPDIIGLSVMTAEDMPDALRLISRLRAAYPKAGFLAGGLFVTTASEAAQKRFPADVRLVSCEGELPLLAAVQALSCGSPVVSDPDNRHLPGHHATSAGLIDPHLAPDEWAIALRPNLERYLALGCAISLQSSRGCPGACSFCATPGLPSPYRHWQERRLSLVVDEMALLAARCEQARLLPVFNFVDDDFGPLARIEALDAELRRRDLRVAYALQLRASALLGQNRLAERLTTLRQGGFTRIFLGVESLRQQTLKDWNKSLATEGLPEVFSALREAGISAHIGYILWHGGSTVEGARAEAERLWEMGLYCPKVAESRMVLFPGSRLHAESLGAGPSRHTARWEPMDTESERFYQQLSDNLRPIYDVWKEGAVLSPWLAAQAHLTGERRHIDALDAILAQCDQLSYRGFVYGEFPEDLQLIANDLAQGVARIKQAALPIWAARSKRAETSKLSSVELPTASASIWAARSKRAETSLPDGRQPGRLLGQEG